MTGGTPQKLGDLSPTGWPGLSPDGKLIVFNVSTADNSQMAVISAESGQTVTMLKPEKGFNGTRVRFAPDSRAIVYPVRNERGVALWAQPLDGFAGKFLNDPAPQSIVNFRWSFDGSKLAIIRHNSEDDVALLRDNSSK
jgi:Tol biopolymer transport system component